MKRFALYLKLFFGIVVGIVLIVNIAIGIYAKRYIFTDVSEIPKAEMALIPGASVYRSGDLTTILKERADTALGLYKSGKVSKVLISGDGVSKNYNEVDPVRIYLLAYGLRDEDIVLDRAGLDTYSAMFRARNVFHASSVIVSTQGFHLPRSIFIAKALGLEAYGIKTDASKPFFRNYIREIFADEKAVFDIITGRKPRFLGETIPVSGTTTPNEI